MIKIRGVYHNVQDAFKRSEYLIKNHDSYHKIYTGFVGKPFPATVESKFSHETKRIDLKKKIQDVISENIISKREKERKDIEDIQQREKKLLDVAVNILLCL